MCRHEDLDWVGVDPIVRNIAPGEHFLYTGRRRIKFLEAAIAIAALQEQRIGNRETMQKRRRRVRTTISWPELGSSNRLVSSQRDCDSRQLRTKNKTTGPTRRTGKQMQQPSTVVLIAVSLTKVMTNLGLLMARLFEV